jgi:hypothetical protein
MVVVAGGQTSAAPPKPLPVFGVFTAWSTPGNLGEPVNTRYEESAPALSTDGLSLYFNRNLNKLDPMQPAKGDEDLYVANRSGRDARWEDPVALESLNTPTFNEKAAVLSRDGKLLYFASDREGFGQYDLYVSHRLDPRRRVHGRTWSAPTNLGPVVNTPDGEVGPFHFVDARGNVKLYFARNPAGGFFDIYVSRLDAKGMPTGTALPVRNLNSATHDARLTIRADGLELILQSNRLPFVGMADLWRSTRRKLDEPWGTPVPLGAVVNSPQREQQPWLTESADELYFASNRPDGKQDDIWVSKRKLRKQ